MSPDSGKRRFALRCLFGRHSWEPHPCFTIVPVRYCNRCLRVETRFGGGGNWRLVRHIFGRVGGYR